MDVNEKLYLYEVYEKRLKELMALKEQFAKIINNYEKAIETLTALKEDPNMHDVLLPLAPGVFINVDLSNKSDVMVSLSSDILAKKPIEGAIEYLEDHKNKAELEVKKLDKEIEDLTNKLEELQQELSQMM